MDEAKARRQREREDKKKEKETKAAERVNASTRRRKNNRIAKLQPHKHHTIQQTRLSEKLHVLRIQMQRSGVVLWALQRVVQRQINLPRKFG
jgi:hypothetical protein